MTATVTPGVARPGRVSIVIPVYNGSNYVAEAIDSALAQTYPDTEVLVVDDGSTDDGRTAAIARGYGNRIRYLAKPNGGVSSALNVGLRDMTGEWFCWLSHDDLFLPAKTERQVAFARAHPAARVIGCDFALMGEQREPLGEQRIDEPTLRNGGDIVGRWVFACALMIHRQCFAYAGQFNERNRTTQDLEMSLRLIERYPFYWLPEVLCRLRRHAESASRTDSVHEADKNEIFRWMLARYDAAFFDPAATAPAARAATFHWLALNALGRQAPAAAALCARRAMREWPSLRNPAASLALLGPRAWMRKERLAGHARNAARRLLGHFRA